MLAHRQHADGQSRLAVGCAEGWVVVHGSHRVQPLQGRLCRAGVPEDGRTDVGIVRFREAVLVSGHVQLARPEGGLSIGAGLNAEVVRELPAIQPQGRADHAHPDAGTVWRDLIAGGQHLLAQQHLHLQGSRGRLGLQFEQALAVFKLDLISGLAGVGVGRAGLKVGANREGGLCSRRAVGVKRPQLEADGRAAVGSQVEGRHFHPGGGASPYDPHLVSTEAQHVRPRLEGHPHVGELLHTAPRVLHLGADPVTAHGHAVHGKSRSSSQRRLHFDRDAVTNADYAPGQRQLDGPGVLGNGRGQVQRYGGLEVCGVHAALKHLAALTRKAGEQGGFRQGRKRCDVAHLVGEEATPLGRKAPVQRAAGAALGVGQRPSVQPGTPGNEGRTFWQGLGQHKFLRLGGGVKRQADRAGALQRRGGGDRSGGVQLCAGAAQQQQDRQGREGAPGKGLHVSTSTGHSDRSRQRPGRP